MQTTKTETQSTRILSVTDETTRRNQEKLRRELGTTVCSWLDDPEVIEIILNEDGSLWVDRVGKGMKQGGEILGAAAISAIGTVASFLNTTITKQDPILECELPLDGSRFEALVPPVVSAPVFTIRKRAVKIFTLDEYVQASIISQRYCDAIKQSVADRKNILVVGGTQSGKTTLTNAIINHMAEVTPDNRLVIIEDTGELQCAAKNKVQLRAVDHVDMIRLLKATMRLRPDRILVGEVRDGAALALLKAWNTGHPGGVATIHANSAEAGLIRLEQLVAEATDAPMHALIAEAVDLVVFIEKTASDRCVSNIIRVNGHKGGKYLTTPLI
jgi:type IV secretion system protein VirB11